jgi:hypothetical protein
VKQPTLSTQDGVARYADLMALQVCIMLPLMKANLLCCCAAVLNSPSFIFKEARCWPRQIWGGQTDTSSFCLKILFEGCQLSSLMCPGSFLMPVWHFCNEGSDHQVPDTVILPLHNYSCLPLPLPLLFRCQGGGHTPRDEDPDASGPFAGYHAYVEREMGGMINMIKVILRHLN